MNLVDIVAMLAVLQYLIFGGLVGRARGKYGVKAPAVAGDTNFEQIYRVQMNTLELLVALLPALYVAARYWPVTYVAAIGSIYLVGRLLYWRAYVSGVSRGLGFNLSMFPVFTLLLAALVPAALGRGAAQPLAQPERQRQAARPGLWRGTFSTARAWRPAAGSRLARTLGITNTATGNASTEN